MKKYTQADYDAMPVIDGVKTCPSGDYSAIRGFGPCTTFGPHTKFGSDTTFGPYTKFGPHTKFGLHTTFGAHTMFGSDTTFEGIENAEIICLQNVDGSGRQVQIISNGEQTVVRAGCFLGSVDDFCAKALSECKPRYAAVIRAAADAFVGSISK